MNQNDNPILYEVLPTKKFGKDVTYYIRKKRFTKLPEDIEDVLNDIKNGKFPGKKLSDLNFKNKDNTSVHKVRVKNSNTKVGKSNGYRIIYYAEHDNTLIFLLTIYYKKDDNLIPTDKEIIKLIKAKLYS